jgi:hypothetical protein
MSTDAKQDLRPGLRPRRLALLMRQAIERCVLDLSARVVLTEAASGAYVVTPVLAAMAGARQVYAVTRSTAYGSAEEIAAQTLELATLAGVAERIEVTTRKTREHVAEADIVTNSGHVRPLDAETISWMKPGAVVPLMYEAWECRPGDIDLDACRRRGIAVAGTNEQHPAVGVFPYLGIMAVKLLLDAGVAVQGSRVLLLCDNPFGPYLVDGLRGAGASADLVADPAQAGDAAYDAVMIAMRPQGRPVVGGDDAVMTAREVARRWPGTVLAQFWGDVDRDALVAEQVPYWPVPPVVRGHMGVLPSAVGPEPIVRLQSGGLKVGEVLARRAGATDPYHAVAQLI